MLFRAKRSPRLEGRAEVAAALQLLRVSLAGSTHPSGPTLRKIHAGKSFNHMLAKVSRVLTVKGKANPHLSTAPASPEPAPRAPSWRDCTGTFV